MAVADPELTRVAALFARVYDRPVDALDRIGDGVNMRVYAARLAGDRSSAS